MAAPAFRFRKHSEFGTTFWNRRLAAIWRRPPERPPGDTATPDLLVLPARTANGSAERPPVRIFLGSEPAQARAERVFVWSVVQARDRDRRYEIHVMKDLAGFDRRRWKTGFTNYRYAIPHYAGFAGRAIYNDVDQIYLADPAELFDTEMGGKAVLSIDTRETSVMLLDCGRLEGLWSLQEAQTVASHRYFRAKVASAGLWGTMSPLWNSRDHEYEPGRSKLLHYTILHKQPWRPFPAELRYEQNELAPIWNVMEREAVAADFHLRSLAT
jgi:hypothetical protein